MNYGPTTATTNNRLQYYDTKAGIGYKAVLDHFKRQASGGYGMQSDLFLPCSTRRNGRKKISGIRVIKLISTDTGNKNQDEPKVQITDPVEAEKNRAESKLARDMPSENIQTTSATVHTPADSRPAKRSRTSTVRSRVKRARDIFDP